MAYITYTPSVTGNTSKWTLSAWVKRAHPMSEQCIILRAGEGAVRFDGGADDTLRIFYDYPAGSHNTKAVYLDTNTYYHVVAVVDTTASNATDRMRMYVNGELAEVDTNYDYYVVPQNRTSTTGINVANIVHGIGVASAGGNEPFRGNMCDMCFVDGQALAPSVFASTKYNRWKPKHPNAIIASVNSGSGGFGTNGFFLPLSDSSDVTNNLAGTSLTFTLTGWSSGDTTQDSATNVFATHNLYNTETDGVIGSNGVTVDSTNNAVANLGVNTGKWYAEFKKETGYNSDHFGVHNMAAGWNVQGWITGDTLFWRNDGRRQYDGSELNIGTTYGNGDIISIMLDCDNRTCTMWKNGAVDASFNALALNNELTNALDNGEYLTYINRPNSSCISTSNFGQGTFVSSNGGNGYSDDNGYGKFQYQPPSGYLALCTQNIGSTHTYLETPDSNFRIRSWEGTTANGHTINYGIPVDFVMIKSYSGGEAHHWRCYDSVRANLPGASNGSAALYPNQNVVEDNYNDDPHVSFSSTGFTMNANPNGSNAHNGINKIGTNYVGYGWSTGQASNSTNTTGSVTTTLRANQDAGFSIVSFTHPGVTCTMGHGLDRAPDFMLVKARNQGHNWDVYHKSVGPTARIRLNTESAPETRYEPWNNTAPSNSVFTMGPWYAANSTAMAYCWAETPGYSKFGSYQGTASKTDAPFVYCGFKPAMVIVRAVGTSATHTNWSVYDRHRTPGTKIDNRIELDTTYFQGGDGRTIDDDIRIFSNGFSLTTANWYETNTTISSPYIYMAFSEEAITKTLGAE